MLSRMGFSHACEQPRARPDNRLIRLAIIQYPNASAAALHGLQELFFLADAVCAELGIAERFVAEVIDSGRLPTSSKGHPHRAVILPPSLEREVGSTPDPRLSRWLKARHAEGAILCAVCAGVFHLAHTGLLNGRPATTHWGLASRFAARFPEIRLNADQALINDGDIITGGGLLCWIDLGLELVGQFSHPRVMRHLGKRLIVDTHRREQRFYQTFSPNWEHGDAAVLGVQKYLQMHFSQAVSIRALADLCCLSERAFLRRFIQATGLQPSLYLQRLRIQEACDLLETTDLSQDAIAHKVGYEMSGSFRKLFVKTMGLSPRDYRARFGNGGSRSH